MKNILVIGGSSGIGKALVKQLSSAGHSVYATYYRKSPEPVPGASYHYLDATDASLNLDFLPEAIHGFVYCPGSINLLPFARIKPQDFVNDFELNVVGLIRVLQAVLPRMRSAAEASVVLFSTVAVSNGFSFHAQVGASKGAVEGLMRSLAAEFAPSIRVNAIAPSLVQTPLSERLLSTEEKKHNNAQRHPLKRLGTAEDIASLATFLLSDDSRWITGQVLGADGGLSTLRV